MMPDIKILSKKEIDRHRAVIGEAMTERFGADHKDKPPRDGMYCPIIELARLMATIDDLEKNQKSASSCPECIKWEKLQ